MGADDHDNEPARTTQFAQDSTSGAAGALVGLAVGGPAGAVAGAVVAAAATHIGNVVGAHLHARRVRLLQPAIEALSDEGAAGRLEAEPRLLALTLKAADIAARTEWEAHVDALAAVLRDGLIGLHDGDKTSNLLDALGAATPDAVAVLQLIAESDPPEHADFVDSTIATQSGWSRSCVRTALRRLEEAGTVETIGGLWGGGEGWTPQPLGVEVLQYLRDVGSTLTTRRPPAEP